MNRMTEQKRDALRTFIQWIITNGPEDIVVKGYGLLTKTEVAMMCLTCILRDEEEYSISEQMLFNTLRRMYLESIKEPKRYK